MSVPSSVSPGRRGQGSSGYTARHLLVLEGLEAVRKRPGMYIGSTDSRGLMHCLWELVDNAVDEALGGHCARIDVTVHADGSIEVGDDGRGIPVDPEPRTGLSGVEVVFTKLHAGGKFGGGSYAASGGLHGVGASVVNALSARLDVEVDREGATWAASFRRGVAGEFAGDGPKASFAAGSGVRKVRRVAKRVTGTRVRCWPDRQVFLADAAVSLDELRTRLRQTAFLVPGLMLTLRDERTAARGGAPVEEEFKHDGGIGEFCDYIAEDASVTDVLRLQGQGRFTETVPVLDDEGHLTPQDVERELLVDVAVRWGTGYDTTVRSFVNVIATPKGGTHVAGFERALLRTVGDAARAARLLRAEEELLKDDVLEGLTAVVTVRLAEPQFEGQTKEVLGTPAATRIVSKVVSAEIKAFLTSNKKAEKPQARAVLEKVVNAARTRVAARQQRDTQRRKNALESSALPAKLADCRSGDVERSELFIVEGDSALGTAKLARNSEYQALLPIRGKILNTQKKSSGEMLQNAECAAIIQVVGAGSGRTFDLEQVRYGKIIFMADADTDGAHIRCLLTTLFHKHMRDLLTEKRVYSAVPPLHRIELSNPKKGMDKYIYTYSDDELQRRLAELTKKAVRWKDPIQRYKGLGEMDANQLAETTMDPRHRTLRRITIDDAEGAEQVFEMLMGNEVAPRKEFIVQGAYELDPDAIDA